MKHSTFQTQHIPVIKPTVLFLCLADPLINVSKYQADGVSVWTLNDYYRVFPDLKPDRIFEIHKPMDMPLLQANGRYLGDHRKIYNESGALIVTRHRQGFASERIFPLDIAVEKFGEDFFIATTSFMFALAIMEGYGHIMLEGIHLTCGDQHEYMIPGMLRNIDVARENCIKVEIFPCGHEIRWREQSKTIKETWEEGIYG